MPDPVPRLDSHQPAHRLQVALRPVERRDLPVLFEFQRDERANEIAAVNPRSADDFNAHWTRLLDHNETATLRTIVADDAVVGCISCFVTEDQPCVGYWVGRQFWGRGIATHALQLLLREVQTRPLWAYVAAHNAASIRVLQKCGFDSVGRRHSPATERYRECEEVILQLDAER